MPYMQAWGERVRARRLERGWSMEGLAERSGTTAATVCRIEAGKRGVSDEMKLRLAAALGTEPGELFAFPSAA